MWKAVNTYTYMPIVTRSVAAGFGQHSMSPPASNDTATVFCFPH